MKRDILPEMYNYNKFPGPEFIHFDHYVKAEGIELLLLKNEKNAFNTTSFGQRFTEILLKYDYIVGDWGNEQLRLKGFYKDHHDVKKASRISRLEDYIKEFCNFGCAYFVLENPNPKDMPKEEERPARRRKSSKANRRRNQSQSGQQAPAKDSFKKLTKDRSADKPSFTSKKRPASNKTKGNQRRSRTSQLNHKTDHFIIRKKDN